MSDEPKQSRASIWWAVVVSLIVLYPLSLGPVAWLAGVTGMNWIGFVYLPIDWAANAWPPLQEPLTWYLRLWHVPGA